MTRFLIFNCMYLYNYFFRISVKRNWECILYENCAMYEAIIIIIINNGLKKKIPKNFQYFL